MIYEFAMVNFEGGVAATAEEHADCSHD